MKPSRRFARSKAFSLLETMVALLVTVICLSLLSSSLKLFTLFEKDRHDPNELVFSYVQFAKFLKKDSQRTYIDLENSNPLKIMFIKEEKKKETTGYYIDFYVASIAEICEEEKPKPEKKFKEKKNMVSEKE